MTACLLVDYNGVLVNDEPLHFAAFRDVLAEHRLALDERTYFSEFLGIDDRSAFVEAWRRARRTVTSELLRVLVDDKAARYAALTAAGIPAVAGAAAFVRACAERWPVAVVSGALRREIDAGLEQLGLRGAVGVVVAQEDVATTKPDPGGYRLALERLGAPAPTHAVVLEDSAPGIAAARAIGAGCVALATSRPAQSLAGADAVWPDFLGRAPKDLEPLLRALA